MWKINVLETSKAKFVKNCFSVITEGIAGSTCFWFIAVLFYSGVRTGFQIPHVRQFFEGMVVLAVTSTASNLYVYQMVCMVG